MVVVPVPVLPARPSVLVLIVATFEADEVQMALAVTFAVVPLL
jgi:hypothetical protein